MASCEEKCQSARSLGYTCTWNTILKWILHISQWLIHEDNGCYSLNGQPLGNFQLVFREPDG